MNNNTYRYDENGSFVISDFQRQQPFSSFLPGIAGVHGKPLWVFYVNRGQGIASFGVRDKDGSILEFNPAHKSYQRAGLDGFRTFIKTDGRFYEPFSQTHNRENEEENMIISQNTLELQSVNRELGIAIVVRYFLLPNESFAALVRHTVVRNLSEVKKHFEILDGLPQILPYGLKNSDYKEMGHTLKSWMDVFNLEEKIPYYKLRASTEDSVETEGISGGHFYFSLLCDKGKERLLTPLVDAETIFGLNSSGITPDAFLGTSVLELQNRVPVTRNKVPCGFSAVDTEIEPGGEIGIYTVIGHVSDISVVNNRIKKLANSAYFETKKQEASAIVGKLTQCMETRTSNPLFDAYCGQTYLDNILRGGHPKLLKGGDNQFIYHVYSRKHGDLERDYNFFSLAPDYYSQGNGNYRDTNQNRRNDVLIHPFVKDFNVIMFMSFIQLDGYNPLIIKGCSFKLINQEAVWPHIPQSDRERASTFFEKPFTPGSLLAFLEEGGVSPGIPAEQFLYHALAGSEQDFEADFGEGYWIDHWTYNLDMIESYLAVYPECLAWFLFENKVYRYYDSPAIVCPRERKHVLVQGRVRQFGAVEISEEKCRLLKQREHSCNWVRTDWGQGEIYKTNLYEKLVLLALTKFTALDPEGIGLEMEADKPGWNDSLNGLPGLFGSGFGELCELNRLIVFLLEIEPTGQKMIELPREIVDLMMECERLMDQYEQMPVTEKRNFWFWDHMSLLREQFRHSIKLGIQGDVFPISTGEVSYALRKCLYKTNEGIERAHRIGEGIYPTYFYYEATDYESLVDQHGRPKKNARNQEFVRVTAFRRVTLPYFLEGPARAMKIMTSKESKIALYLRIKESGLYDQQLKMYKVSQSLNGQPNEIGRACVFSPGWLENESVFLHMEYKYFLELLKGGLYDQFFDEIRHALIPFLDSGIYGRSTIENCSFIASSSNPDPAVHGKGFVARLSGAAAEFISMWNIMMWGERPFVLQNHKTCLKLKPVLPEWLFDSQNKIRVRFLDSCDVIYHNPKRLNTFGEQAAQVRYIRLYLSSGEEQTFEGDTIPQTYAFLIRKQQAERIEIELG